MIDLARYDWSLWLPPKATPTQDPQPIVHKGEIWAFWDPCDDERCVVKVCYENSDAEVLIGYFGCYNGSKLHEIGKRIGFGEFNTRTQYAILVARAGEEPTDPDLLYQFLY